MQLLENRVNALGLCKHLHEFGFNSPQSVFEMPLLSASTFQRISDLMRRRQFKSTAL